MVESMGGYGTQVKTLAELHELLLKVDDAIVKRENLWVYENKKIVKRYVTYHPYIYHIFEHLLVLATDNPTMDTLIVNIHWKENVIEICAKGGDEVQIYVDKDFHDLIFMYFGEFKIVTTYHGRRDK
ncbi:hypothetical protein M0R45_026245 [Rubus argutus]|uniref:Uncharacterized protein n=1 Tax=Rubus argutus TaxID=59490 RepID=A0AAW1WX03_RUBAR